MSDILNFNVIRVFDANGAIVPGAKATFFDAGTSNPRTVYADSAGTTPHSSPLVADSEGVFAAVFVTGATAVKVSVTDADDVVLTGYPIDPAPLVSADGGAASLISFTPTTEIPETEVQAAIERVQTNLEASYDLATVVTPATARANLGLGGLAVLDVIDEDDLVSDSATRPPSQQSVKAYVDAVTSIGVDQSWQDMTGSRAVATSYQNTTGRPIMVSVCTQNVDLFYFQVSTDNSTWVTVGTLAGFGSVGDFKAAHIIVPASHYYKALGGTLAFWSELRT